MKAQNLKGVSWGMVAHNPDGSPAGTWRRRSKTAATFHPLKAHYRKWEPIARLADHYRRCGLIVQTFKVTMT